MRYSVKIYIGTKYLNDEGTNVLFKITAENEEEATERALNLLNTGNMDAMVYEI